MTNEELLEILREVPDPEDEGYCQYCHGRLELITIQVIKKDGDSYSCCRFKHDERCYYGKIQRALGLLESADVTT